MYCPKCRVEYRPGFTQCFDCQVALVPELPPEPQPPSEWTPVLETNDPLLIGLAKAALDDAGIPYLDNSEDSSARLIVGAIFPLRRFLVPGNRELDARAVLDDLYCDGEAGDGAGSDL